MDVHVLAQQVRPLTLVGQQGLAVLPSLQPLLPEGLPRGGILSVGRRGREVSGATSLSLALAAGPSQAGAWVAVVGMPSVGLVAAAELGVSFERLVVVDASLPAAVAAVVDGFDVVLVGAEAQARLRRSDIRRLVARVRERGGVLLAVEDPSSTSTEGRHRHGAAGGGRAGWSAHVRLQVTASRWEGIGPGYGHLQSRRVTVEAIGRGAASRLRQAEVWLPAAPSRGDSARFPQPEAMTPGPRALPPQAVEEMSA